MNYDEVLDLVSSDDKVVGQEKRSVVYEKKLTCFRVINGFICNSEKKLWIHRRHHQKKLFPLHLDASVGGHVMAGETYQDAFVRETQEELGFNVLDYDYSKIARLTPHEHNTSAFMWVYVINSNEVPAYNKNDFIEFEWLMPDEVFQRLEKGDKAKSDLVPILHAIKGLL